MTITQIILAVLLFIQASCITSDKKGNKNSISSNDSCKAMLASFNYPDDLNRLDTLNYICQDSFLQVSALKKDLKVVPLFSDRNYMLLNYDFRTKLLYDKRNGLNFCFKRSVDYDSFNKESIYSIYVLDKNKMPLYLIEQLPFETETNIAKLYYDDRYPQLYGYVVKRKTGKQPMIKDLSYADIVEISKELLNEEYILTNKFISYETPHFKTKSLWTDN